MKYTDITPVYKKGDTTDKTNYRPTSTLSNFSKILEKLLIYAKINSFIGSTPSRHLAGLCAKHNTQYALINVIETCHAMINKGNNVEKIIMDLSKAFDKLNQNLLLCKLKSYGFNKMP